MKPRDNRLRLDPLRLVTVRKTLKAVAHCLADLDNAEANRYLVTLGEEIEMLKRRETDSLAWRQAVSTLDDVRTYGLDRIQMLPTSVSDEKP